MSGPIGPTADLQMTPSGLPPGPSLSGALIVGGAWDGGPLPEPPAAIQVLEPLVQPYGPVVSKTGPWDTVLFPGDLPAAFSITFTGPSGFPATFTDNFTIDSFDATGVNHPISGTILNPLPGGQLVGPHIVAHVSSIL